MPNRAKLTTRGISVSTVSTDTLPKNASLTNNELDSNFLNLRDQSFSIVGDDSSGIDIRAGDTIKFLGAGGAQITAVGDTITVTAGGGGGASLGDLEVSGTTLRPTPTNSNITISSNSTGSVTLNADYINLTGSTGNLQIHGAEISTNDTNGSVYITPNGTGNVVLDGLKWPNTDGTANYVLTTDGVGNLSWTASGLSIGDFLFTSATLQAYDATYYSTISTSVSNGDIKIEPNGTGRTLIDNLNLTGTYLNLGGWHAQDNSYTTITNLDSGGSAGAEGDVRILGGGGSPGTGQGNVYLDSQQGSVIVRAPVEFSVGTGATPPTSITQGGALSITELFFRVNKGETSLQNFFIHENGWDDSTVTNGYNALFHVDMKNNKNVTVGDVDIRYNSTGNIGYYSDKATHKFNVIGNSKLGAVTINENEISTYNSNQDLILNPNGTGVIQVNNHILPEGDLTLDLGAPDKRFRTIYLAGSTINLGDASISAEGTGVLLPSESRINGNLIVSGNLQVDGTETILNTQTLEVQDNKILLNSNVSGSATTDAGIEIKRGTDPNKSLIWNETTDKWSVGTDTFVAGTLEGNLAFSYLTATPTTLSGYGITDAVSSGSKAITITGDDSTGTDVNIGETFKIAGAGSISTSVSGDTLTISAASSALGLTFVGDDSTGTRISDGETVKIAGASNISTAVSGDTLTITGPDLSSYATTSFVTSQGYITNSPITVVGDDSTGTTLNSGETIKIAGTQNVTTAVSGDTLTITGPNLAPYATTSYVTSQGYIQNISLNFIAEDSTSVILTNGSPFTFNGQGPITTTIVGNQLNIGLLDTDDFLITGTTITTETTNSDINITPNGTGYLVLDGLKWPQADGTNGQVLKTDGAGNLSWGSATGSDVVSDTSPQLGGDLDINTFKIISTANGDIVIAPNGTGKTVLGSEFNGTTLPYTNVSNSFPEFDDGNIRENLMFYSNLSIPNITTFAERQFANARYAIGKADSSATTYNDTDFRFQNSDFVLFDMNGATANSTVTNARGSSLRATASTVGFKNSGGGTKITPNMIGSNAFYELQEGHGGDLTTVNAIAVRGSGSIRGSTTDISRITNAFNFLSEPITTGGNGTNGVARIVTNEYGFYHDPTTTASLVTNHYGLYINSGSAATNKYGVVVADASYSNTLGGITLQNGTLSTADSTAIQIDESLNVSGTLNAKIIVANEISSEDSTAIQINDAVNISGTLSTDTLKINNISSGDSTAIQLDDSINVSGTLTANIVSTANINSATDVLISTSNNNHISLVPNGTGDVYLSTDLTIVGDSNTDATITTNGTGDLILSTNNTLANSPTITIGDTTAGNITIKPALGATVDTVFNQGRVRSGINDWDTTVFSKASGAVRNRYLNAGSFSHTNTRTYDLPTATARHYGSNFGLGTTLAGATNLGNTNTSYRALQSESHLDLAGISATNAALDGSVANYSGQAVGLSAQAFVKNLNATAATNPEAVSFAAFNQIGDSTNDLGNITLTNSVNYTGYTSVSAATGRTTAVTNAMGFVHTGTRVTGAGTKTITNEYAFRVLDNSQATNKYAFYADNDDYLSRVGTLERYKEKQNALTSSSTITVDADLAPVHTVTLAVNTGFVITGLSTGQTVTIIITQDGVGSKTATFGTSTSTAVKFPGGAPTLSTAANAIDVVKIYNDGTNFLGTITKAYS